MAKRKKSRSVSRRSKLTTRPAAWFTSLGFDDRNREAVYLNTTVKMLRQYFTGFDASDGYDLRHIERMSIQRRRAVEKYGALIHNLTASPHYRAVARTKKEKQVLTKYTGQIYRGKKKPRAFVVHHPEAAYRDIKIKVNKEGRVQLTRKLPGVTTRMQTFLFIDYGFNPKTFTSIDSVIRAVKKMIKSGDMPKGYYQLETTLHGSIWYAMERDDIILNLQEFGNRYQRSSEFSQGMIGFTYHKDEIAAEIKANALKELRRKRASVKEKHKRSNQMRAQLSKWQRKYYGQLFKKAKKKPRAKK